MVIRAYIYLWCVCLIKSCCATWGSTLCFDKVAPGDIGVALDFGGMTDASSLTNRTQTALIDFDIWYQNPGQCNIQWDVGLSTVMPPPRQFHSVAHYGGDCVSHDLVIIFGGKVKSGKTINDAWSLDICTSRESMKWNLISIKSTTTPQSREKHSSVGWLDFTNLQYMMIIFGGLTNSEVLSDLWLLKVGINDDSSGSWTKLNQLQPPPARAGHSMGMLSENNAFLFGGFTKTKSFNDLWYLDILTYKWTQTVTQGSLPLPRAYATVIRYKDKLLLFGGFSQNQAPMNDMWSFDTTNKVWVALSPVGVAPSVRFGHNMIIDPYQSFLVMKGGYDLEKVFDDTWAYNISAKLWTQCATIYRHKKIDYLM